MPLFYLEFDCAYKSKDNIPSYYVFPFVYSKSQMKKTYEGIPEEGTYSDEEKDNVIKIMTNLLRTDSITITFNVKITSQNGIPECSLKPVCLDPLFQIITKTIESINDKSLLQHDLLPPFIEEFIKNGVTIKVILKEFFLESFQLKLWADDKLSHNVLIESETPCVLSIVLLTSVNEENDKGFISIPILKDVYLYLTSFSLHTEELLVFWEYYLDGIHQEIPFCSVKIFEIIGKGTERKMKFLKLKTSKNFAFDNSEIPNQKFLDETFGSDSPRLASTLTKQFSDTDLNAPIQFYCSEVKIFISDTIIEDHLLPFLITYYNIVNMLFNDFSHSNMQSFSEKIKYPLNEVVPLSADMEKIKFSIIRCNTSEF